VIKVRPQLWIPAAFKIAQDKKSYLNFVDRPTGIMFYTYMLLDVKFYWLQREI